MSAETDVLAAIGDRLALVAPYYVGGRHEADQMFPPAYVFWITGFGVLDGPDELGHMPRWIGSHDVTVQAEFWAVDEASLCAMSHALDTAVRQVLGGANQRVMATDFIRDQYADAGRKATKQFSFRCGVPEVELDGWVGPETAPITQVAIDGSAAVVGDSLLTGGEG